MRDVLPQLLDWWRADERAAVATVVRTFRSAPREPGAAMAVGPGGEVVGSVSGGCVEGAVYDLCLEVAETGRPVLARYGVSDDAAFEVGLTCGGTIEVLVTPLSRQTWPGFERFAQAVMGTGIPLPDGGLPASGVCLATVIAGPDDGVLGRHLLLPRAEAGADEGLPDGGLGHSGLDAAVTVDAVGQVAAGVSAVREYGPRGERTGTGTQVFLQVFAPRPRLLVFGAIDFAAAMARVGRLLGYRVTVCDARPIFATPARFPEADEVVTEWPHRYLAAEIEAGRVTAHDAVCVLTHDAKFDVPLLRTALTNLPAGTYVGAMGSRRAHAEREARLIEDGVPPEALARLRSPIGLDLGARTPDETAVSIAAEMIAARSGASARPLRETDGPIHG
ncbi:XdhC family protein [Promicromonospora soli]|uniref:Xanthine dehydrogenase n=1 Tax=Promicromonospora soli TaxID=2035533 RepID=A0A919KU55_9MICO|nr:XdhC/CoxI family protein [Promicromonospora soli]GHH73270.1 xanthine dehydrogenase [Promicromonospora soli]